MENYVFEDSVRNLNASDTGGVFLYLLTESRNIYIYNENFEKEME